MSDLYGIAGMTFSNEGIKFNTPYWDDLRFPAQGINPAGSTEAASVSTSTGMLEFVGNKDCVITGAAQMPHSWLSGSAIHLHVHLLFPTANTSNSRWKLEHNIIPLGGNAANAYGSYTDGGTITITNPNNARAHIIKGWNPITMTGSIGSTMVLWRITRLASDTLDNDSSTIILAEFDIHFQVDKVGSPAEIPTE
jgi:hypothetical protein